MRAVIVTGTRKGCDYESFVMFMRDVSSWHWGIDVLIQGEAPGIDQLARRWAQEKGVPVIGVPAPWRERGKSAGTTRNYWMLDILLALGRAGYEIAVWAFPAPDSRGTRHMMKIAEAAGVAVHNIEDKTTSWKYAEFEP